MDFAACCITDQEWPLLPTSPGLRELSRRHALGPSARVVGVSCLSDRGSPAFKARPVIRVFQARHRGGHHSPLRVSKTIATRPLSVRDGGQVIPRIEEIKRDAEKQK